MDPIQLLEERMLPNRSAFAADPFGYSANAWYKWGIFQGIAGFPIDPTKPPTSDDLKSPLLWLSHAHALSEAAGIVIRATPNLDTFPRLLRGVCDSQYCAIGLMLIGYSLEVCLKAMLILTKGVKAYTLDEKKHRHHDLVRLSELVPNLSDKDRAILQLLTHFLVWAGRYPDPGSGFEAKAEGIYALSEKHEIAARDMFSLASRVMAHARVVIG